MSFQLQTGEKMVEYDKVYESLYLPYYQLGNNMYPINRVVAGDDHMIFISMFYNTDSTQNLTVNNYDSIEYPVLIQHSNHDSLGIMNLLKDSLNYNFQICLKAEQSVYCINYITKDSVKALSLFNSPKQLANRIKFSF